MRPIKNLRVVITTCNRYLWALEPFAHLFNKYWHPGQQVIVGGFAPPSKYGIKLPDNFTFHQIQRKDIPKDKRSDGFIAFFNQIPDDYFVWMLEDFWLVDFVDADGIETLFDYMRAKRDILRVDLTIDRVKSGVPFGTLNHLTLIESPRGDAYRWSHQGALWNKALMMRYLRPGEGASGDPIENRCTDRLNRDPRGPRVLGTMNWPLKYAHVIVKNQVERHRLMLNGKTAVPAGDIQELRDLGLIDCEKKLEGVNRFNEGGK